MCFGKKSAVKQSSTGLKVGDRVRVTRTAESHEGGWENSWEPDMDLAVGQIGVVTYIGSRLKHDIGLMFSDISRVTDAYSFPEFVLEKVVEPRKFQIGDRVRVSYTYGHGWDGDGKIISKNFMDMFVVKYDRGHQTGAFYSKYLTLIEPAGAPVPPVAEVALQSQGTSASVKSHNKVFLLASKIAVQLGQQNGSVSADQVQAELVKLGYSSTDLGNAAGALFRNKNFKKDYAVKSGRKGNHAREITKWQYVGAL